MKVKTSVTLSEETLAALHAISPAPGARSQLIESFILAGIQKLARDARRQAEIDALNIAAESSDVLDYSVSWEDLRSDIDSEAR